jgi:hypothetical protein
MVADAFGYHALQVGLPNLDFLRANRMPFKAYVGTEVDENANFTPRTEAQTQPDAFYSARLPQSPENSPEDVENQVVDQVQNGGQVEDGDFDDEDDEFLSRTDVIDKIKTVHVDSLQPQQQQQQQQPPKPAEARIEELFSDAED